MLASYKDIDVAVKYSTVSIPVEKSFLLSFPNVLRFFKPHLLRIIYCQIVWHPLNINICKPHMLRIVNISLDSTIMNTHICKHQHSFHLLSAAQAEGKRNMGFGEKI